MMLILLIMGKGMTVDMNVSAMVSYVNLVAMARNGRIIQERACLLFMKKLTKWCNSLWEMPIPQWFKACERLP